MDPDRDVHPRPPSGFARLTSQIAPALPAGGIVDMPADSRHHDDHHVIATTSPSPCRPTPEITSASTVTPSSTSSATANTPQDGVNDFW